MPRSLSTPLSQRLGIALPIVQGPMNGGSTPEMVVAVSNAGGLGSLAAASLSPEAIRAQVATIRAGTSKPFAINLFVLDTPTPTDDEISRALERLQPIRAELGLEQGQPLERYCENFREQLDALVELKVPVASFTFGLLDAPSVRRLHDAGSLVIGTATSVAEARAWEANGADIICAQGAEAGGHRGTFLGDLDASMIGTLALVPQIVDAVSLPVIAAGGIMDGRGIAAALTLGAQAAQLGTAFLTSAESPIHPAWKAQIRQAADTSTRTSRTFTGRPARGIVNDYIRRMAEFEQHVPAYPVQNALTAEIRKAAGAANRTDFISMWAGQAAGLSRRRDDGIPAEALVHALAEETAAAFG
ncbi:NAD(P)H-dependent flavin oxidoreductase [Burkholderia stagnalis]|uniref:NAD(P)H-dependent flavin oxidoreductase n=1 Tax=Burkholderia stagnalis TaxID=1503054 RepID=UPI0007582FE8|nr:nitronate monooxygenase [Burkholderia stagnalis]KVM97072.1 nitronate monooxygenase [Burkholderia stagnalis]KWE11961.1 nitronate monooxygenase [Burkholderia stagnalis]KWE20801.1 nitronate monooxygenase [Burkholderia stagnalis]KWO73791.1 nitronate monooxygenase [Burkholderia stagnalis]